jgi:PAS domain S-box-containing protein
MHLSKVIASRRVQARMLDFARPNPPVLDAIRGFAEDSPAAIAVLQGAALQLAYINPAFAAAAGQPAEALWRLPLAEAFPALLADGYLARLRALLVAGGNCRQMGQRLPYGPPGLRWDIEVSLLSGLEGGGLLVQLRAAPEAAEGRHRSLVEAVAVVVWSATPDGRLLLPADWTALTGQPAAEAADWGWLAALHPEDHEPVRQLWEQALRTGTVHAAEYRIARPDGGWRWTAARAAPLRDAAGEIHAWVGAHFDIEDRRHAETALRASEARFRTLAEAMPHLFWQTDARGEPEYVNARWQAMTGLGLEETRGGGWMAALHPDDVVPLAAAWGRALAQGGECDADLRILCANGEYRWHRLRAAPVHDAAGVLRHWVGTCSDIEERHQAEARLHQALAAQDALVREAEHRIRNGLQLVASLLRLQAGRVAEPAARDALEAATIRVQAVAEAHRALQLGPDLRSLRLADMLRELAAGATTHHPGADIRVEAPAELILDADRAIPLALALSELVATALRQGAGAQGGMGAVRLSARIAEDALLLEVSGPGTARPFGADQGLGATMIRALAKQVGAVLTSGEEAGGRVWAALRLSLGD